jgi:DinB superfamily
MNAHLAAGVAVLDESYDDLIDGIRQVEDDALTWTPQVADGNSVAVLVRHIVGSNDALFRCALGEPVLRDRDAEFRFRSIARELIDIVTDCRASVNEQAQRLARIDPATLRRFQRLGDEHVSAPSIAWCIVYALVHTAGHWGQIQLNRNLKATSDKD